MKNIMTDIVFYLAVGVFVIATWMFKSRISRKYDFDWAGFYASRNGIKKLVSVGRAKLDRTELTIATIMTSAFLTIAVTAVAMYW